MSLTPERNANRVELTTGYRIGTIAHVKPALDVSRLKPVLDWEGGPLRVYAHPLTTTKLEPPAEYVPFGKGYALPAQWKVTRPDGVIWTFGVVEGAPRLLAIEVTGKTLPDAKEEGPAPVGWLTGEYLRDVAIDREAARTAQHKAVRLYRRPRGEVVGVVVGRLAQSWAAWTAELDSAGTAIDTTKKRPGRKPVPDERVMEAAAAVREAEAKGEPRVRAVMVRCHAQESQAKKYIRLARQRGFLPKEGGEDA